MQGNTGLGSRREVALARPALIVLALCLLAASLAGGRGSRSLAQAQESLATPATPVPAADFNQLVAERPVEIHAGSCAEPGETIASLTPLDTPEGEAVGQGTAIEAERSYTILPIPIESILAGQASVSVSLSSAESDLVIACGEIGGVPSEGGSVVLTLPERNGSGFTGIAFFAPAEPGTSAASVFLAGNRTIAETRELAAVATPEPLEPLEGLTPQAEPTPTVEPVQVVDLVLLEWVIDMPEEIRAGQVNFVVTNEGSEPHSLVIEGQGITAEIPQPVDPGQATIVSVSLAPGEYVVYCPDAEGEHREAGMETTLVVSP